MERNAIDSELIRGFENNLIRQKKSANTVYSYKIDLTDFFRFLIACGVDISRPEKINKTNLLSYIRKMTNENISPATISRRLASIRAFYKFLMNEGLVRTDITAGTQTTGTEKKLPTVLTVAEVESLLSQPSGMGYKSLRDKAMLELLYATGMKVTELLELKISDIYFSMKYVKCGKKERVVPFGDRAYNALVDYMPILEAAQMSSDDFLFTNISGEQMSRQGFWKVLKLYAARAGIEKKISPQILRHSVAVHMLANGADVLSVKDLLGHVDLSSALQYLNKRDSPLHEVYKKSHPLY